MTIDEQYPVPGPLRDMKPPEYLLKNIRLVDPRSAVIREDTAVYVQEGMIREIFSGIAVPSARSVVDGCGAYMIPGIVDMHVHLVWDGSPDPLSTMKAEGPAKAMERGLRNAMASLRCGVTTVRDLGSVDDVAIDLDRVFQDGQVPGPTVVAAGRIIQPPDGHVPDLGYIASSERELIEAVRFMKGRGAALIKVAATGGAYGPEKIGPLLYDCRQLAIIVTEAHRLGLKVAAHALGEAGITAAVLAGIDTIEHGAQIPESVLANMVRRNTVLIPTLAIYRNLAESTGQIPDFYVEKARKVVAWQRETLRAALSAGALIALGTDAGSPNFGPHPSVFREMEAMVDCGMSSAAVLRAATVNAAYALGMGDCLGVIEPGKRADAVLLRCNPLARIFSPADVVLIMKGGKLLSPDGLIFTDYREASCNRLQLATLHGHR